MVKVLHNFCSDSPSTSTRIDPAPSTSTGRKRRNRRKRKYSDDDSLALISTAKRKIKPVESPIQSEIETSRHDELSSDTDLTITNTNADTDLEDSCSDTDEETPRHEVSSMYRNVMHHQKSKYHENSSDEDHVLGEDNLDEFDYNFFKQKRDEFCKGKEHLRKKRKLCNEKQREIKIEPVEGKNAVIVLIDHPGSITLYQYVSVEVISGSVSICGSELTNRSPVHRVFSSEATGLIELKTVDCKNLWANKEIFNDAFKCLLNYVGMHRKAKYIMKHLNYSTVIVRLAKHHYQPNIQLMQLYYPDVFKFNIKEFSSKRFFSSIQLCSGYVANFRKTALCFTDKEETSIRFGEEYEDLAQDIIKAVRDAIAADISRPRILVYGSKNTGKSVLLRFLVNKVLSLFPNIYYLDGDPGQTEFTPSGVVSLTEMVDPIFGPPFCHQRNPLLMAYTGGVSASLSPTMYTNAVSKMVHLFKHVNSQGTLFVNTIGWVKGIGLCCLKSVLRIVKPTIVIEMINDEDPLIFDYRKYVTGETDFYQIRNPIFKPSTVKASEYRSLALLSYFGKCLPPHGNAKYLNDFQPVRISWDDVPVYDFQTKVPPLRMFESLNASVVALCNIQISSVLYNNNEMYPMTLEEDTDNECIGFGIVRAVDEINHMLCIVTPLRLSELSKVNAIMKGNVMLPNVLFMKQAMDHKPMEFTDASTKHRRTTEEASCELYPDIAEKYGKIIKDRFGLTKKLL